MKTITLKLILVMVMLLTAHLTVAEPVRDSSHATPLGADAQIAATELVATEARLKEIADKMGRNSFRLLVDSRGQEVKSQFGEEKVNEAVELVDRYHQLSRDLGQPISNTDEFETRLFAAGVASSDKESKSKKSGDEETPEEKEAREAAEKRAAKKAAQDKDGIRALEQAQNQNQLAQQLAAAQQGGQGGKGKNSGGQSDSGSSQGPTGFPQQNNSDDNSQNQFSNGFDRLANRLGNLGNQGFGNFSSSQNSSKKDDDKKPSFSLPPSKNSSGDDFKLDTKPKTSLNLPQLQTGNQSMDLGRSTGFGMQGTPVPAGSYSNNSSNSSMKSGNSGSGMSGGTGAGMGGMLGGQSGSNQASLGSLGGDFPFNITGETFDEEAEYDGSPRYRVYDVSMTGSSTGGGDGASAGEAGTSNDFSVQSFKKNGIPQFLYFITPEEQSLKGVPGIFRSLAAGYQKTRVQMLCHLKDRKKIGLCEKVRKDLES
jgi:hypothetical protein